MAEILTNNTHPTHKGTHTMTELQWACQEAEKHPGTCTMLRKNGGVWTAEVRSNTHNGYNAINLGQYPYSCNTVMATVLTDLRHALTNGHQVTNTMIRNIDAALNMLPPQ